MERGGIGKDMEEQGRRRASCCSWFQRRLDGDEYVKNGLVGFMWARYF